MTATPIPRTVAMTVFGDLEVSTLPSCPPGRAPIQTHVVPAAEQPAWIDRVWAAGPRGGRRRAPGLRRLPADRRRRARAGPTRRTPDADDEAPTSTARRPPLGRRRRCVERAAPPGPLAGLRVELLHGRMPADEKDRTMRAFAAGEIDVLVATTVIEVGVDVANATDDGAARRRPVRHLAAAPAARPGRPRAPRPALCLLVSRAGPGTPARERLEAVAATADGFELARVDLEQRREGDVLGARRQSGLRSSAPAAPAGRCRDEEDDRGRPASARRARLLDAATPTLGTATRALRGTLVRRSVSRATGTAKP